MRAIYRALDTQTPGSDICIRDLMARRRGQVRMASAAAEAAGHHERSRKALAAGRRDAGRGGRMLPDAITIGDSDDSDAGEEDETEDEEGEEAGQEEQGLSLGQNDTQRGRAGGGGAAGGSHDNGNESSEYMVRRDHPADAYSLVHCLLASHHGHLCATMSHAQLLVVRVVGDCA